MSKLMKILAVVIFLLMVAGSIALASVSGNLSGLYQQSPEFNWAIAIIGVLFATVIGAVLYAIGYAIDCMEATNNCIYEIGKAFGVKSLSNDSDTSEDGTLLEAIRKQSDLLQNLAPKR